jgi:hypothetical protein
MAKVYDLKNWKNQCLWFFKFCPFQFAPNLQVLMICAQTSSLFNIYIFSFNFFVLFPSCKACMSISYSSSHVFNSINNTHQEEIITSTKYSWDVKNTHDLIDS